ncbi:hypothetical protein GCM10022197_13200 [Microlunatus spumicola]|uniref:Uncharacterized protein n=1 Tax=Microlunatus spumicola TaxID=81499 RepID=A0ABP6WZN4_9ACTN
MRVALPATLQLSVLSCAGVDPSAHGTSAEAGTAATVPNTLARTRVAALTAATRGKVAEAERRGRRGRTLAIVAGRHGTARGIAAPSVEGGARTAVAVQVEQSPEITIFSGPI